MAFSYLHPRLPVQSFCLGCPSLVFAADSDLWSFVQCASVEDSNSANRACCACWEPQWCPFDGVDQYDSGYCRAACAADPTDATCHALAAGCSANVRDVGDGSWGDIRCSEWQVKAGACALCKQPAWCDDGGEINPFTQEWLSAYGAPIKTPAQWLDRFHFFNKETGPWTQDRQCKFKGSQKTAFVTTANAHMAQMKQATQAQGPRAIDEHTEGFAWNEVNMYWDGGVGDGGLEEALSRNLLGLLAMDGHGAQLDAIADKFAQLGLYVPRFVIHTDGRNRLDSWDPMMRVDLAAAPYHLKQRV